MPDMKPKNILFLMFDQLRFDYLSCAGHPHLDTPHIDWLASQGVRFTKSYVQSPVCGPARMSFYTGRYVSSHGAAWNGIPLKVGELTLGDHLREAGMDAYLIGKTHMKPDSKGLERLGIAADSLVGKRHGDCGFDAVIRDDGLWGWGPNGKYDVRHSPYNAYLNEQGYDGENPWHDYANSGIDEDGNIASGWIYKNAKLPANIKEEDSETPWLTRQAISFLQAKEQDEKPWLCHVSYIKPHWPYIVPAPYHDMYGPQHYLPVSRHKDELENRNPVYAAFSDNAIGQALKQDDVRDNVMSAYMGLIKQIDDQMGVLFDHLRSTGQIDDTIIILTSDHGDYLGDHWLGEKDLFHEQSVKVPLIIYDPSPQADATRGTVNDALVESIDIAATAIDYAGADVPDETVEGLSLRPFIEGRTPPSWRDFVVSEYDMSMSVMANKLEVSPDEARLFMVADNHYKMMHSEGGHPPMLFDLENDPEEFFDLGRHPDYQEIIAAYYEKLHRWSMRCSQRNTLSNAQLTANRGASRKKGIVLGIVDGTDIDQSLIEKYQGPARQNFLTKG